MLSACWEAALYQLRFLLAASHISARSCAPKLESDHENFDSLANLDMRKISG